MRPAFRIEARGDAEGLAEILRARLAAEQPYVDGDVARGQCTLRIPQSEQRFWTPFLDLMFEDAPKESGGLPMVRLWGTFSPRAEVWTAFVFAIGTLVVVSVFAGVYGVAQLVLGRAPFALLIPLAAICASAFLYVAALVGQGLSISDMYRLRAFLDDCLRESEEAGAESASVDLA